MCIIVCVCVCVCVCVTFFLFSSYSHLLLKQLTELERGGHIKHGGDVNTTPGGRNEGDASLRGNVTLFRLTTDAMVKVLCIYIMMCSVQHVYTVNDMCIYTHTMHALFNFWLRTPLTPLYSGHGDHTQ